MNANSEPKISRRRPSIFWSSPLKLWARSEIRTIRFRRAPPGSKCALPPPARLVARKKANGQDEDLFIVFSFEDEGKIYLCASKYFSAPPPPKSRYSGAGPVATHQVKKV